jgi:integrase
VLKTAFGFAVDYYEMLGRSPVNSRLHRPKAQDFERAFYEPERLLWFLEKVRSHYLGPPIWLQALTGMRAGEAQFLRGRHLDFKNGQILIEGTFNNKTNTLQDFPKGRTAAYVPMIGPLAEFLRALGRGPDEFVAQVDPDSIGGNFRPGVEVAPGSMLPYETYLRGLKRLCRFHGLPELSTHELRHSCSELWVSMGATQEDVRRLLNQKSVQTTARYIHRTDGRLTQIGERIKFPEGSKPEVEPPMFPTMFPTGNKVVYLPQKTGGGHSG